MIFQQEFGALIGAAVLLLLKKAQDKLPGEGSHSWSVAGRWAVGWEGKGRAGGNFRRGAGAVEVEEEKTVVRGALGS